MIALPRRPTLPPRLPPPLPVVLALVLAVSGCGGATDAGAVAPPSMTVSTGATLRVLPSTPPPATTSSHPSPPPASTPRLRDATWTSSPVGLDARLVGRSGSTYVVLDGGAVSGYGPHGREVWSVSPAVRGGGDAEAYLTGDVVVVTADRTITPFPGTSLLEAVDVATGRTLWRDTVSFPSAWGGYAFSDECTGEQDHHLGDCLLSARDPHTGAVVWTTPTYASASVVAVVGDQLVVDSHPDDSASSYQYLDADTGAAGSAPYYRSGETSFDAAGFVTASYPDDRRPCTTTLERRGLDGERVWRQRLRVGRLDPERCESTTAELVTPRGPVLVGTYSGAGSAALDPATGRVLVSSNRARRVALAVPGLAVLAHLNGAGTDRGVDLRTGRTRWMLAAQDPTSWYSAGAQVLRVSSSFDDDTCVTDVVDPVRGRIRFSLPGAYVSAGPGYVTTTSSCQGYDDRTRLRVYDLAGAAASPHVQDAQLPS